MKLLPSLPISEAREKVLKSGGWLLARQAVNMVNTLVLGVLLARHLGPEGFGVLSYTVSLVAVLAPLTTLGLKNLSLREYAQTPAEADQILGTITVMRVLGTLVSIAAAYFVATRFPIDHENIAILCVIAAGAVLFKAFDSLQEYFIADQDPKPFVINSVLILLFFTAVKVALILGDYTVDAFILANAAQTAAQSVGIVIAYRRNRGAFPGFRVDPSRMKLYARQGFPLMMGAMSAVIYLKIDVLFLSNMAGKEVTGIYSVAARLAEAWYMLPATLALAAFPRMVQLRQESQKRYNRRMQDALDVFAAFGTAIAVTSIFWAEPLIRILFGPAYAAAVPVLQIYVWIGIVFATRALIHKWLLAEGFFWGSAMINLTGAVSNVILNLALIPRFGAEGAAVATVISYTLAPILLAPIVPSLRPVATMQLKAIVWPRRLVQLYGRGGSGQG